MLATCSQAEAVGPMVRQLLSQVAGAAASGAGPWEPERPDE
ncbi:MAG: hypothetical protein OXE74_07415 [Cyanobacteria bacterium MAG CAR2_bin_4]|nr:hypothetical protein [Cyanobacteria bacterium MAG CAR2_bin_4]